MLARGTGVLQRGRAVAAITTYTLESTAAIVRAAERLGRPVLLSAGASSYGAVGREPLAAAALAAAHGARVPVGVHLDHCRDAEEIDACLALGYSSVMIDGSHLPFEENVALTREVVARAHAAGAWVEAELGALSGDEDRSGEAAAGGMTDPAEAAEFAELTGVDALAVAVGSSHAMTERTATLDFELIGRLHQAVAVPLVLHGSSGVADPDLTRAVEAGMTKVNIATHLNNVFTDKVRQVLADNPKLVDTRKYLGPARAAVAAEVARLLGVLKAV